MSQQTECLQICQNCSRQFPQSKLPTHFGYCRRNIKRCNQCNQLYDVNNLEQHQQQFHKKIKCKYCQYGFMQSQRQMLNSHQDICEKKTKYCQYCQLNVPALEYEKHFSVCQARTRKCENCGKCVKNKEFYIHVLSCEKQQSKSEQKCDQQQMKKRKKYQYERQIDILRNNKNLIKQESNNQFKRKINQIQSEKSQNSVISGHRSGFRSFIDPEVIKKDKKSDYVFKNVKQQQSIKPENKGNGIKRSIKETFNTSKKSQNIKLADKYQYRSPQSSSQTYTSQRSSTISNINKIHPRFNPKDYMDSPYGNYNQDEIPQQALLPQQKRSSENQQQQIQKAILQSLGLQQKISSSSTSVSANLPKQFQNQQLLKQQFMQNFDIEKQIALFQEMERQQKQKLFKLKKK